MLVEGLYDGETDVDNTMLQVHAGDDSTYIVFTYTPSQTIAEGQLKFVCPPVHGARPQRDATGDPGFTELDSASGSVTNEDYNEDTQTVTADISLSLGDTVEIHYGGEDGGCEGTQVGTCCWI